MIDGEPTNEQIQRVSKAAADALKALDGMPTHAYYSMACTIVHDVAVLIQEKRGDRWQSTLLRILTSVAELGQHAQATREAGL